MISRTVENISLKNYSSVEMCGGFVNAKLIGVAGSAWICHLDDNRERKSISYEKSINQQLLEGRT